MASASGLNAYLPLLLLGGGVGGSALLVFMLLSEGGYLDRLLGTGDNGAAETPTESPTTSILPANPAANMYDVAAEEVRATGSVSNTTAELLAKQQEAAAAQAAAENEARLREAELEQQRLQDQHMNDVANTAQTGALIGGVGGAMTGLAVGATIGSGVPIIGTLVGAGIGAAVGYFGSGYLAESSSSGDWWPFW